MNYRQILLCALILIFPVASFALQVNDSIRTILWKGIQIQYFNNEETLEYLYFDRAVTDIQYGKLPVYFEKFEAADDNTGYEFSLDDLVFEKLDAEESVVIMQDINLINSEIDVRSTKIIERKKKYYGLSFIPFRKNRLTGEVEKLISFEINLTKHSSGDITTGYSRKYSDNSVLSNGKWHKIAVNKSGVHSLKKDDLKQMGIDPSAIDPRKICIYGNGGKMLPENNSVFRYDDLVENAIFVKGEDDGVFDDEDYILFYGTSPDIWEYDTIKKTYYHIKNLYSDRTYYFINIGEKTGKRIETEISSLLPPTSFVNKFDDRQFYEKDEINLIGSGKLWYGEEFSNVTTYVFPQFSFPDIDISSEVTISVDLAARSFIGSTFSINATGMPSPLIATIFPVSHVLNTDYAKRVTVQQSYFPSVPDIDVTITYNKSTLGSVGWLNYIELNAVRHLRFSGDQMGFRNAECAGNANITEFSLSNASAMINIWDVSDPLNVKKIDATPDNSMLTFRIVTDTKREFVAFNGNSFYEVEYIGEVENQNLHALGQVDMIIVSHHDFLSEAERLAAIHLKYDNLSSCIVTPAQIYNEFSSGSTDVTAIRDFVKMLYDKAPAGSEPKYLLLFGDGSYDNRNILNTHTNFIPTYQSSNSLLSTSTFVTDDYFGLLDEGEGDNAFGSIDIGIGRLPVQTIEQARSMVNKIEHYLSPAESGHDMQGRYPKFGDWRNTICFVADDEDGNLHLNQAEYLTKVIGSKYRNYNIDKIYLDAYPQVSTPGGARYPEVNEAIKERMSKGSLLINYIGHGGKQGWAFENVLEISDIVKWDNFNTLPVFLTATCEFSRFDDPYNTTAGELVVLNPDGGGVAIFSTTRVAFASSNFSLTISLYDHVFEKSNNEYPRLGDLIRLSKNDNNNDATLKNFVLLGDPALKLNYPEYSVITDKINNQSVTGLYDTLKAYDKVSVSGFIEDEDQNIVTDFNGILYPVIYDKASEISTLGNDNGSKPLVFKLQNNILYKARVNIVNGEFSFSFVMPRDINYNYGEGKISYYAENGFFDASGFCDSIIIGGTGDSEINDHLGPLIDLYINNTDFISGGLSNKDPLLLAYFFDENGINAYGNGIGHEITAILDGNTANAIVLNPYYQADLNTYKSGRVEYRLNDLEEGLHKIIVKAWDMFNNSSEAGIEFYVTNSNKPELYYAINYPNPFIDRTHFIFNHNQAGKKLAVSLQIFSITGQKVFQQDMNIVPESFNTEIFTWDGRDDNENSVAKGVYVYRISVRNEYGMHAETSQKLVILK